MIKLKYMEMAFGEVRCGEENRTIPLKGSGVEKVFIQTDRKTYTQIERRNPDSTHMTGQAEKYE
jgi:hypothetical protein